VLQAHGYTVLSVPSHGPGEHGKDILAKDSVGRHFAFQLKGGNITKATWYQIRGEVEDLVRVPVVYPGLSKKVRHTPILVTNGDVTHDARESINYYDEMWAKDGNRHLKLWQRHELLKMFLDAHSSLLPSGLESIRDYMQLFVTNFRDRMPRERFARYLQGLVSEAQIGLGKQRLIRGIWNMVLLAGYVLEQYRRANNVVSVR